MASSRQQTVLQPPRQSFTSTAWPGATGRNGYLAHRDSRTMLEWRRTGPCRTRRQSARARPWRGQPPRQPLRTHVARRSGDRAAGIRSGAAVGQVCPAAEPVELLCRVRRRTAGRRMSGRPPARVIQVAAGKEKQLLEVLRRQQPAPDAVLGVATWASNWAFTCLARPGAASPWRPSARFLKKSVSRSNGSARPSWRIAAPSQ